MTEDMKQKEMRLRKELAQVKALNQNAALHRPTNRNLDIAGIPVDTTPKPAPSSRDIPDVITLPPKRTGRKENIPW
jgi:hypothetical protein|tara:strand:- start:208 stop:435 length:228 start_codon:yes stop_codon:yes gene_type:complete